MSDAGRKIAKIEYEYDYNNNPVRIQFTNGIDKYQFEEGYCQATPLYWEGKPFAETFTFCYYDQDHLGNVRQVTMDDGSKKGEVIQRMNYYPFGAEFCDNSTKSYVQNHKYNGKEFDNMHGLNTYDYGARQYNPILARWDRIDPLCEKYYSTSPYAYCANNPVRFIDPDGRDIYLAEENRHELLCLLQSLTNDKLGVDKNGYVHIYAYNTKNKDKELNCGSALIRGLAYDDGLCIIGTNDQNQFKDHTKDTEASKDPQKGSESSVVLIDLNGKRTFDESDWDSPTVQKGDLIMNIALGHELIHAFRDLKGVSLGKCLEEEEITTGIRGDYVFTENKLRKEQGQRKRVKY